MWSFLKRRKEFTCGGEHCIEFKEEEYISKIYYRQPTGDELINFAHDSLELNEKELEEFSNKFEEINAKKIYQMTVERLLIPAAKKIIIRIEGYTDSTIEGVEKYYPHHLQRVTEIAYKSGGVGKKKF